MWLRASCKTITRLPYLEKFLGCTASRGTTSNNSIARTIQMGTAVSLQALVKNCRKTSVAKPGCLNLPRSDIYQRYAWKCSVSSSALWLSTPSSMCLMPSACSILRKSVI